MSKKRTLDHFFQTSPVAKKVHVTVPDHDGRDENQNKNKNDNDNVSRRDQHSFSPSRTTSSNTLNSTLKPFSTSSFSSSSTSTNTRPSTFDPTFLEPSNHEPSHHETYPFPIPQLPDALLSSLEQGTPAHDGKVMNDAPNLDVISFTPFLPRDAASALFHFLRSSLPYYRVCYTIRRGGGPDLSIKTPRYTSVFGVDATGEFVPSASKDKSTPRTELVDRITRQPIPPTSYPTCRPRPVPECLDVLRRLVEVLTGVATAENGEPFFNFVLVNYYADGTDSISWHSDDERFLGANPTIASMSLGSTRDFLLRHKPLARDARKDHTSGISGNRGTFGKKKTKTAGSKDNINNSNHHHTNPQDDDDDSPDLTEEEHLIRLANKTPLKFPMATGDMILMQGKTQSHWLHSVPKRSVPKRSAGSAARGGDGGGRINITFRRALVKGGTENYYQYNVGKGPVYGWDGERGEMVESISGKGEGGKGREEM